LLNSAVYRTTTDVNLTFVCAPLLTILRATFVPIITNYFGPPYTSDRSHVAQKCVVRHDVVVTSTTEMTALKQAGLSCLLDCRTTSSRVLSCDREAFQGRRGFEPRHCRRCDACASTFTAALDKRRRRRGGSAGSGGSEGGRFLRWNYPP